jgi:hypothetical protein
VVQLYVAEGVVGVGDALQVHDEGVGQFVEVSGF